MPKKKEKQSHRHHKSKSWRGVVDYSSSEEKDFEKYLLSQNYSLTLMESDGNCLFRAIAHQIEGNQESHDFYRQRVMDYISLHKDHFQLFIEPKEEGEEEEGMEDYIERLRRLGEWGGQPELFAATQCFHVNIQIYRANLPTYLLEAKEEEKKKGRSPSKLLRLSYHGSCHYNSILPLNDSSSSSFINKTEKEEEEENRKVKEIISYVPWAPEHRIQIALKACLGNEIDAMEMLLNDSDAIDILEDEENYSSSNKEGKSSEIVQRKKKETNGKSKTERKKKGKEIVMSTIRHKKETKASQKKGKIKAERISCEPLSDVSSINDVVIKL